MSGSIKRQITAVEITYYDPSRSNLIASSRKFDDAVWGKYSTAVTADAIAGPDNLTLADKWYETATTNFHVIAQWCSVTIGQSVWLSIFAKAAGRTKLRFQSDSTAGTGAVNFDLATGAISGISGITAEARLLKYDNGWYRCCARMVASATGSVGLKLLMGSTAFGNSYAGDGTSGFYLDKALIEVGSVLGDPIDTTAVAGPGLKISYFSTEGFTTKPTDAPPNIHFDPRLMYQPNIKRTAFSDARVTGGAEIAVGEIRLNNKDQALHTLLDMGLSGRDAIIRVGTEGAAYPSAWTTFFKGTIEQVELDKSYATLRFKDKLSVLDLPAQATRYAGTNTGSPLTGAEGVADIQGKVKPFCYGRVRHVPAIMVNTSKLTYQVADSAINSIDAVYDMGNAFTPGADFANLAALEAATPAAGTFVTCLALGLFRLGSAATGRITADVRGNNVGGYINKAGEIINRFLIDRCGVLSSDVDSASFTALNAAATQEVGFWSAEEMTRKEVIEKLMISIGAWVSTNRNGLWVASRLIAPSGSPLFTINDASLLDIERIATGDKGRSIPVWRTTINHKRYYARFQRSDLAGIVSEANKADLINEWRTVVSSSASVQTTHLLSPTIEKQCLFDVQADATAEASRLNTLHGVRRDFIRVKVPFTDEFAVADLGSIISVQTSLLGYSAGKTFVCVGVGSDGRVLELDLWG